VSETSPAIDPVETLTVMFTDLVDSTGMRVRLGEEQAERVRERHDRSVRAAIVATRGRIAKHTGDGVKAIFMGVSDALAAAVALQQDLDADNQRHRERGRDNELLRVRIGISAGDVTVDGEDCLGLPVVEAQRLGAAAQPGQIVSELVSALARGRGGHELRGMGQLELKGLKHPVEAEEGCGTRGRRLASRQPYRPGLPIGVRSRSRGGSRRPRRWRRLVGGEHWRHAVGFGEGEAGHRQDAAGCRGCCGCGE
jgi:class 3 adenylate cyclase